MNKAILSLIALGFLFVDAEQIRKDTYFSSVCITEKTVTINWDESKQSWAQAIGNNEKYIVKRIEEKDLKSNPFCEHVNSNKILELGGDRILKKGCYNIKEFSKETNLFHSEICNEIWLNKENTLNLLNVDCENFKFIPNGVFQTGKIYGGMNNNGYSKPDDALKWSPYVSVGTCSKL